MLYHLKPLQANQINMFLLSFLFRALIFKVVRVCVCVCVGKYWRTVKGDFIKNISEI